MTIKTLDKKMPEIKREVELLRSLVIGHIGRDSEGNYKPSFVTRALKAVSQKPKYEFNDPGSFLKHLREK